jgi:type IV pilus assembly protein PilA
VPKKAGTKSNHASVVKYVAAELKKCELGDTGVMKGKDGKLKLTCSERKTADKVADGAVAALAEFKNTYGTVNSLTTAVRKGAKFADQSACTTTTEGVTRVTNTTSAVTVSSCPGTGEDPLNDEFIIE